MQNLVGTPELDNPLLPQRLQHLARGAVMAAILIFVFVTLTPFTDLGDPKLLEVSSGNETATYLVLFGLVGCATLLLYQEGSLPLRVFATREHFALLAWLLCVSVALSVDPNVSARRFMLSFATFLLAAMSPWLAGGLRQFANQMLSIAVLVLLLSYLGVLLTPHLAIHQATDLIEQDIAGDWRGLFGHKNAAAAATAVFVYVGWFVARLQRPGRGILVMLAAFGFLLGSGGKSSLGMVLVVGAIAFLVDRTRSLWGKALIGLGPLVLISTLTVGSVISDTVRSVLDRLPIDVTFTGRTEIWGFAMDALASHPWKGQGFEAFWYSNAVRFGAEDSTRWMVDVATSHNSYVDLALTVGLPGLLLVLLVFMIGALRDFHHRLATPQNTELSRFFLVLWLFSLYLGTFEAFFLSRDNPMWFVLALATCGLRYTAHFEVRD